MIGEDDSNVAAGYDSAENLKLSELLKLLNISPKNKERNDKKRTNLVQVTHDRTPTDKLDAKYVSLFDISGDTHDIASDVQQRVKNSKLQEEIKYKDSGSVEHRLRTYYISNPEVMNEFDGKHRKTVEGYASLEDVGSKATDESGDLRRNQYNDYDHQEKADHNSAEYYKNMNAVTNNIRFSSYEVNDPEVKVEREGEEKIPKRKERREKGKFSEEDVRSMKPKVQESAEKRRERENRLQAGNHREQIRNKIQFPEEERMPMKRKDSENTEQKRGRERERKVNEGNNRQERREKMKFSEEEGRQMKRKDAENTDKRSERDKVAQKGKHRYERREKRIPSEEEEGTPMKRKDAESTKKRRDKERLRDEEIQKALKLMKVRKEKNRGSSEKSYSVKFAKERPHITIDRKKVEKKMVRDSYEPIKRDREPKKYAGRNRIEKNSYYVRTPVPHRGKKIIYENNEE